MRSGRQTARDRAVELIVSGRTSSEVAKELGIHRATVNGWRHEPEFAEQLRALQDEIRTGVYDRLVGGADDALSVLRDLMLDEDESGFTRLGAVKLWLELIGLHKQSPAQAPQPTEEVETEADLDAVLDAIPPSILERHLAKRRKERDL